MIKPWPNDSSALAVDTPRGRATANRRAAQRLPVARTLSSRRPTLVQKPATRRIGIVLTDGAECRAYDEAGVAPERAELLLVQSAAWAAGRDPGTPKNFVRHPVSNPGKSVLEKEDRLDRRAAVSPNELPYSRFGELNGRNFWRTRFPPAWRASPMMEADPAELPCIAENKRPLLLSQDEVIMLAGSKISRFHPELAAHSKMNPKPVVAGKNKEHLFAAGRGGAQLLACEATLESCNVRSPKQSLLPVQLYREDLVAHPGVPLFPKIFHLGQLRHRRRLDRSRPPCYPSRAWKRLSLSEAVARA